MDYTREELISICNDASVPQDKWRNRDSADAQRQMGDCLALLRAGCQFEISHEYSLATDEHTIWIVIRYKGFDYFELGEISQETFYLPTRLRLEHSQDSDWY